MLLPCLRRPSTFVVLRTRLIRTMGPAILVPSQRGRQSFSIPILTHKGASLAPCHFNHVSAGGASLKFHSRARACPTTLMCRRALRVPALAMARSERSSPSSLAAGPPRAGDNPAPACGARRGPWRDYKALLARVEPRPLQRQLTGEWGPLAQPRAEPPAPEVEVGGAWEILLLPTASAAWWP
jgi:hypothetical protein